MYAVFPLERGEDTLFTIETILILNQVQDEIIFTYVKILLM